MDISDTDYSAFALFKLRCLPIHLQTFQSRRLSKAFACIACLLIAPLPTFAADTTAPTIPAGLTGTAPSSTQVNLSWTASTDNVGVTGYQLDRCTGSTCTTYSQIATPTTTSYVDTGRSPNTTYRYRVRARDAIPNWSGYSSVRNVTTLTADAQAPSVPVSFTATPASTTQVNLSWAASSDNVGVTGYQLDRCTGATCTSYAQIATPTSTTYSDTGRTASTTYRYRVRARDAVPNWSGYSTVVNVATPAADTTAPSVPSGLIGAAISSTQVSLSWTASTDNVAVTGYQVDRCTGASCTSYTQIATPTETTYNDTGRSASTTYRYRVRARDAVPNWSAYSTITNVTTRSSDSTPPTSPTGLVTYVTGSLLVSLDWSPATDNVRVTGYRIERCTGAGCIQFLEIASVTQEWMTDESIEPATHYRYRVRARDAANNLGPYSNIAEVASGYEGPATYSYTYDALGRIKSVSGTDGSSIAYDYDANGNVISIIRQ